MSAPAREIKFVKALLRSPQQRQERSLVFLAMNDKACSLPLDNVLQLRAQGVVHIDATGKVIARPEARCWLKRQSLAITEQQALKQMNATVAPVQSLNDTILRLSKCSGGTRKADAPFLSAHHVLTANRIADLINKAQIRANITQNLDALALPKAKGARGASEIGDFAIDCRAKLQALLDVLPKDCRRVLIDVCGFEKGLQQIEFEMQWPRRSAKLVLRMALEIAASHWRIDDKAVGPIRAKRAG